MRVALSTHGCRLNQAETDALQGLLRAQGHEIVEPHQAADLYVLNTCTITGQADADARRWIRRTRRERPEANIALTGCYAQAEPQAVGALPGVDLVFGNGDKGRVSELLGELLGRTSSDAPHVRVSSLVRRRSPEPLPPALPSGRVRALLKVQDGCNYRCAFCIVPSVRGPSRSIPVEAVIGDLRALVQAGAPEVVLTGIHLGTYGRDLRPRRSLADLVAALLPALGSARLRLSSIDPHEVDDALVALLREQPQALCRHVHLPVQSADPDVLRRMRRGHTVDDFVGLVERLVAAVPGIAIGTDVIVGFPGESDAAFERTLTVLGGLPLAYHHVFTYSERRGTAAASMPDAVPVAVRRQRNAVLRSQGEAQARAFQARFVGAELDAIVEFPRQGRTYVMTDNFLHLATAGDVPRPGARVVVRLGPDGSARVVEPAAMVADRG